MHIRVSPDFKKELIKIKKRDLKLTEKVEKQLILFSTNPKHSSLRTHKLSGKLKHLWSISITKSIRMVYILTNEDEAYFIDLGTHDEVYSRQ